MYKTAPEAASVAGALASALASESGKKVMIAPPFTALYAVREALKGSPILLGAQNACAELEGAHTGEISLRMLRDAGVSVVHPRSLGAPPRIRGDGRPGEPGRFSWPWGKGSRSSSASERLSMSASRA